MTFQMMYYLCYLTLQFFFYRIKRYIPCLSKNVYGYHGNGFIKKVCATLETYNRAKSEPETSHEQNQVSNLFCRGGALNSLNMALFNFSPLAYLYLIQPYIGLIKGYFCLPDLNISLVIGCYDIKAKIGCQDNCVFSPLITCHACNNVKEP